MQLVGHSLGGIHGSHSSSAWRGRGIAAGGDAVQPGLELGEPWLDRLPRPDSDWFCDPHTDATERQRKVLAVPATGEADRGSYAQRPGHHRQARLPRHDERPGLGEVRRAEWPVRRDDQAEAPLRQPRHADRECPARHAITFWWELEDAHRGTAALEHGADDGSPEALRREGGVWQVAPHLPGGDEGAHVALVPEGEDRLFS